MSLDKTNFLFQESATSICRLRELFEMKKNPERILFSLLTQVVENEVCGGGGALVGLDGLIAGGQHRQVGGEEVGVGPRPPHHLQELAEPLQLGEFLQNILPGTPRDGPHDDQEDHRVVAMVCVAGHFILQRSTSASRDPPSRELVGKLPAFRVRVELSQSLAFSY